MHAIERTGPARVVYAGGDEGDAVEALASVRSLVVDTGGGVEAVRDLLAASSVREDTSVPLPAEDLRPEGDAEHPPGAVDCVVSEPTLSDGDWRDLLAAVREHSAHLPVVLAPPAPDGDLAAEAGAAGVAAVLPVGDAAGRDRLADRVTELAADHRRRRRRDRESEMFRALMDEMPLAIYFKDDAADHVAVSDSMDTDHLGRSDREILGEDEEAVPEPFEDDLRVIEDGDHVIQKEEYLYDDGWVLTSKVPWRVDGDVRGVVGVTTNIDEIKGREEELRRKNRQLTQYVDFVSHDLRNPISIAQGYLEHAVETGDEDAVAEALSAVERMEDIVDDLFEMALADATPENLEWLSLRALVERTWDSVDPGEATLLLDVPEGTDIKAGDGQLRQLLANLFRNAVDHAGRDVTVTVGLTETGFYVADDGRGIDAEDRESVFEAGVSSVGSGVGLVVAKEIAEAHGWSIGAESAEEGGARFAITDALVRFPDLTGLLEGPPVALEAGVDVDDATPAGRHERGPDDVWTVWGGGRNLWRGNDECYFLHGRVEGDVRLVARVATLEPTHDYAKAGVMLRGAPEAGSPLSYVGATAGHGAETLSRPARDDKIDDQQYPGEAVAPAWYRLDRVGSTVACYVSADGETWRMIDQQTFAADGAVAPGLAVCSHDVTQCCEARFEDVRVVELSER